MCCVLCCVSVERGGVWCVKKGGGCGEDNTVLMCVVCVLVVAWRVKERRCGR